MIAVFKSRPVAGEKPLYLPDPRTEEFDASKLRSAGWLIPESPDTIQLAGYAGAGGEVAFDGGFGPTDTVPAPPMGGEGLAVVEVRGDSANPYLRSGDRVYFRT